MKKISEKKRKILKNIYRIIGDNHIIYNIAKLYIVKVSHLSVLGGVGQYHTNNIAAGILHSTILLQWLANILADRYIG